MNNNIKNIEVNLDNNFFNLRDSMCYDSGINVLHAEVLMDDGRKYEVDIETQGHVKVFWHGDMYKHACQMPQELIDAYYNGTIDLDDDYEVVENNWWEISVYRDGKYLDGCSGLLDCNPADFKDLDEVKSTIIEYISYDFN